MKIRIVFYLLVLSAAFAACKKKSDINKPETIVDDRFDASANGWTGDFADYPSNRDVPDFELSVSSAALPPPLDGTKKGIRLSGHNRSDDLFMFIKKQVTGLKPNHIYDVKFEISLASNAPANSIGSGGSPGLSVYLGAGLSAIEPQKVVKTGAVIYSMNINKINQSNSGEDMKVIGNIANGVTDNTYTQIQRSGQFKGKTDSKGAVWLIIGTDSGYEGVTTLYYTRVKATFAEPGN